jgi:hypothetical protein
MAAYWRNRVSVVKETNSTANQDEENGFCV